MQSLRHIIFGYVKVDLCSGNPERFLNLCTRQGIEIWDIQKKDGRYTCYLTRDGWKSSQQLQEKTNTELKILGKAGLPFFLCKYRKRKLFVLGIVLCMLLLFGLSQFVWEISVSGNVSYTKEDITKFIDQKYVKLGTPKLKVNCAELEEQLRVHYDEIAWVSCSLDGCRLSVHIKETLDKNTKNNARVPCDLVASKSGTITSIVTQNGTPLVKKGDKIKKGDTLITGNIYLYSDSNEVLETYQIIAEGEIWAKTKVNYESTFSRSYYEKKYQKKKSYTYALHACGRRIPLMPEIKQQEGMDQITEQYPLKIGNTFYLPFYFERTTTRRFTPTRKEYGKQEAYQKAQSKIKKKIQEFEKKGMKVLSQDINIQVNDTNCEAKGYFTVEEPVGKVRAIEKLTKEQENKIKPTETVE
ncbi:MAG: sporulation protein YqfD [Lachnospiraceae bacterium]|nr:sporulation protein YqfD [Lachnospiraceae bacterium]